MLSEQCIIGSQNAIALGGLLKISFSNLRKMFSRSVVPRDGGSCSSSSSSSLSSSAAVAIAEIVARELLRMLLLMLL